MADEPRREAQEVTEDPASAEPAAEATEPSGNRTLSTLRGILLPALALLAAFAVGAIVIVVTDFDLLGQWGSDPVGAIGASWSAVMATRERSSVRCCRPTGRVCDGHSGRCRRRSSRRPR